MQKSSENWFWVIEEERVATCKDTTFLIVLFVGNIFIFKNEQPLMPCKCLKIAKNANFLSQKCCRVLRNRFNSRLIPVLKAISFAKVSFTIWLSGWSFFHGTTCPLLSLSNLEWACEIFVRRACRRWFESGGYFGKGGHSDHLALAMIKILFYKLGGGGSQTEWRKREGALLRSLVIAF